MTADRKFAYEARIIHKEKLLIASAAASEELLRNRDLISAISHGLQRLGNAVEACRCYLFDVKWNESLGEQVCNQRLEWTSSAAAPQIDNPALQNVPFSAVGPFMAPLVQGQPFHCIVAELESGSLKELLAEQDIVSLLVLPIHVDGGFWGFVGFDDCKRERRWSAAEISILVSFASAIASAVTRRRIEDDLESTRNEAIRANKAKSEFLANITHEIRTPLHGLIGYAEMLAGYDFPPPQREHYDSLRLSARTLAQLITDILDFSKIEAGVFELEAEDVTTATLVDSAVTSVVHLAERNRNRLDIVLAPDVPPALHIDGIRLRQVLVNLLSNALKFTTAGTVRLSIGVQHQDLHFVVEDSGIGMDTAQLQRLFQPFTQFDSSIAKRYQGSGLGLAITRHILAALGSELRVTSQPGNGSRFTFALPLAAIKARAEAPPADVTGAAPAQESPLQTDILVVDDNSLSLRLAVTMLQGVVPACRLHTAGSGGEALRLVGDGLRPSLVLMDLQMPEIDGFETTRRLLAQAVAPMKVIALTASATDEVRRECQAIGMEDFMTKPFNRSQLRQLLERNGCL